MRTLKKISTLMVIVGLLIVASSKSFATEGKGAIGAGPVAGLTTVSNGYARYTAPGFGLSINGYYKVLSNLGIGGFFDYIYNLSQDFLNSPGHKISLLGFGPVAKLILENAYLKLGIGPYIFSESDARGNSLSITRLGIKLGVGYVWDISSTLAFDLGLNYNLITPDNITHNISVVPTLSYKF